MLAAKKMWEFSCKEQIIHITLLVLPPPPPEVSSMKYCHFGVFKKENFRLIIK